MEKTDGSIQQAQLIEFHKGQLAMIVGTVTVLFLVLNFVVQYVDGKFGVNGGSQHGEIVRILDKQTAILSELKSQQKEIHDLMQNRTQLFTDTKAGVTANASALGAMTTTLQEQTRLLQAQTIVLQKLSTWMDIQIRNK